MKHTLPLALATAALLPLAACNNHPKADTAAANVTDNAAAGNLAAAPVEMPPAIRTDKTFRCKDNSLVYVTFFQGDTQAVVKNSETGPATVLKAATAGDPYTAADGTKLTGDEKKGISLSRAGATAVSCHV